MKKLSLVFICFANTVSLSAYRVKHQDVVKFIQNHQIQVKCIEKDLLLDAIEIFEKYQENLVPDLMVDTDVLANQFAEQAKNTAYAMISDSANVGSYKTAFINSVETYAIKLFIEYESVWNKAVETIESIQQLSGTPPVDITTPKIREWLNREVPNYAHTIIANKELEELMHIKLVSEFENFALKIMCASHELGKILIRRSSKIFSQIERLYPQLKVDRVEIFGKQLCSLVYDTILYSEDTQVDKNKLLQDFDEAVSRIGYTQLNALINENIQDSSLESQKASEGPRNIQYTAHILEFDKDQQTNNLLTVEDKITTLSL